MAFKNYSTKKETKPNYEVVKNFGKLSDGNGMVKELRLVSWNGNEPKFDIRPWGEKDGEETCGKGITLTAEETEKLFELLKVIAEESED